MSSPPGHSRIASIIAAVAMYCATFFCLPCLSEAQPAMGSFRSAPRAKVIIDTDVGSNVDDAFAIAFALSSPELDILGFSTTAGDPIERARIIQRMLKDSANEQIPVLIGSTPASSEHPLKMKPVNQQKLYGEHPSDTSTSHPDAVEFIRQQIRQFPGEITLVTIGPLTNVGMLIDRDPQTFRQLKRVVMMGGWLRPVTYAGSVRQPRPEYNAMADVGATRKLLRSGVPVYVMPVDSTFQLALDADKRNVLFAAETPLTRALAVLYRLWPETRDPILFDALAVMFAADPNACPVEPMNISIDEAGITHVGKGAPNVLVCMQSDADRLLDRYLRRVTKLRGFTE